LHLFEIKVKLQSNSSLLGSLDLEYLSFGLNVSQCILVDIFALGGELTFFSFVIVVILVKEWVFKVSN
jgi:hypothetical protein